MIIEITTLLTHPPKFGTVKYFLMPNPSIFIHAISSRLPVTYDIARFQKTPEKHLAILTSRKSKIESRVLESKGLLKSTGN